MGLGLDLRAWEGLPSFTVDYRDVVEISSGVGRSSTREKDGLQDKTRSTCPCRHPKPEMVSSLDRIARTVCVVVMNGFCCVLCQRYERGLERRLRMVEVSKLSRARQSDFDSSFWKECYADVWCHIWEPGPALFLGACIGYSVSITAMHQRIRHPKVRWISPLIGMGLALVSASTLGVSAQAFALTILPMCALIAVTIASVYDMASTIEG